MSNLVLRKFITLALLAFAINAGAQKAAVISAATDGPKVRKPLAKGTAIVSGIIEPLSFSDMGSCAFSIIHISDNRGYVTGTNAYLDREKMMRYTLSDYGIGLPAHVDTAYAYFKKTYVSGNSNVSVKIYAATATDEPGALLGTSLPHTVSSLDTSGYPTTFVFTSPVNITTNKYFVSVDISALYAAGDSLDILCTEQDCVDTDTSSAWELFDDGRYKKLIDSWPIKVDMGILSYVTGSDQVGISNVANNSFSANARPVPASNTVTISFVGQDNARTTLHLKDITGKTIASSSVQTVKGSSYQVPFDITGLSSGMYFVELVSAGNKGIIKVSIQ